MRAEEDSTLLRNETEDIAFEEEEDEDELETADSSVQLGFVEHEHNALFADKDWQNWDGGRIGGKPMWLNPRELPSADALTCSCCQQPLKFLLQVYCPVDHQNSGFHRSLYLFCCKSRDCLSRGSVKCLRTQLSRRNEYYAYDPATEVSPTATEPVRAPQCALCGCRGALTCGQCKQARYCCKAHQKEHWKAHKLECNKPAGSCDESAFAAAEEQVRTRSLFPEYTLAVEEEVFAGEDEEELQRIMRSANIWEDAVTEGGADEEADAKLTQADYQRAMGSEVHDPTYINFLTRVERGGKDQVLRYCRAPPQTAAVPAPVTAPAIAAPAEGSTLSAQQSSRSSSGLLLLSSDKDLLKQRAATLQAHPCPRCGAARTFEFQVMLQLLHFLKVDQHTRLASPASTAASLPTPPLTGDTTEDGAEGPAPPALPEGGRHFVNASQNDIDWGSLDVFTCSASCDVLPLGPDGTSSAYVEELVLIQPPVYRD